MAYCTVNDLRIYKGLDGTDDDGLLSALIARAEAFIDRYTGRTFAATADSTRYFEVGLDAVGGELLFDEDLAALTEIVNDADAPGGGTVLVEGTDFVLLPRNRWPKYGAKLLGASSYAWSYRSNAEMGVTVTGRWAFSVTPPADIVQAAVRLSAYFYAQKDAQIFDTTAYPDAGMMTVPQGLPRDVKIALDNYRKVRL